MRLGKSRPGSRHHEQPVRLLRDDRGRASRTGAEQEEAPTGCDRPGQRRTPTEGYDMKTTDDLMALDMEYRLTIAHRVNGGCECAAYFARRREVLIPEVLRLAGERNEEAVDLFAAFARRVHLRHLSGLTLAVTA